MKLKIKVGPILIKNGSKELKIEDIHIKAKISIEEIPVLAKEILNITKHSKKNLIKGEEKL